jgi:hypothetical protein
LSRLALLIAFFLPFFLAAPARVAAALSIQPAQLSVEVGRRQQFTVSVTGSDPQLRDATLRILAPPEINYRVNPPMAGTGVRMWVVELGAGPSAAADTPVAVVARVGGKIETATIIVSPKPSAAAATQLSAELMLDRETLLEGARSRLLLRISNLSDYPLRVSPRFIPPPVLAIAPDCAVADEAPCAFPLTLRPRSSEVIAFTIGTASSPDHPLVNGRHVVTAVIEASRDPKESVGPPWTGSIALSQPVTVGVPGLSEVQAVVQVPSFLLLPGFLACIVFMMTWRKWRPGTAAPEGGLPAWLSVGLGPALWVIAIPASFLIVLWLYPALTQRAGLGRREILYGFELSDVIRVWLGSMLLGFFAAVFGLVASAALDAYRRRNDYAATDTPLEILRKMKARGRPLRLTYDAIGTEERLYALDPLPASGQIWAAPQILYDASGDGNALAQPLAQAIAQDELGSALDILKRGMKDDALTARWAAAEGQSGARKVDATRFDRPDQKASLLEPG